MIIKRNKRDFPKTESPVFLKKDVYIKSPKTKMLFFLIFFIFSAILYLSGVECVWKRFFGVICPGCGITHAFLLLLHGDLKAAVHSNFMVFSLPIPFFYILFDGRIFKNKKIDILILTAVFAGFIIQWIYKLKEGCFI